MYLEYGRLPNEKFPVCGARRSSITKNNISGTNSRSLWRFFYNNMWLFLKIISELGLLFLIKSLTWKSNRVFQFWARVSSWHRVIHAPSPRPARGPNGFEPIMGGAAGRKFRRPWLDFTVSAKSQPKRTDRPPENSIKVYKLRILPG